MNRTHARFPLACAWLLTCLAVAALATEPAAQVQKSDSKVKITAKADKPGADGKQLVTLTLAVESGWHLYANPVGNEDFADNQTVVSAVPRSKHEVLKVEYPAGKVIKDKTVGDYKVYEDTVTIKAEVRRAKDSTEPLELNVKLQACNDKTCLLPATAKVKVE
jgi:thiol:disulfide interchange protein